MKLSNGTMHLYLKSLSAVSNKVKGKLGYCVARNIRKLNSELVEFENTKNKYICEHGEEDENGTFSIDTRTNQYKAFLVYMKDFIEIEHDVDITKVSEEEIFDSDLTANEILSLDFMIFSEKNE